VLRHCRHLALDLPRLPYVVAVEKRDEVSARRRHSRVSRPRYSTILLAYVADTVQIGPDRIGSGVTRPVVDHHDLVKRIRLREDALESGGDVGGVVEGGDDHADLRTARRVSDTGAD